MTNKKKIIFSTIQFIRLRGNRSTEPQILPQVFAFQITITQK